MTEIKKDNIEENECGCGHDHDHDHEEHETVTLELENGEELICPILELFEVNEKEYIALLHPVEELAILYGFSDNGDGSLELIEIIEDAEYELVSAAFNAITAEYDDEDEA